MSTRCRIIFCSACHRHKAIWGVANAGFDNEISNNQWKNTFRRLKNVGFHSQGWIMKVSALISLLFLGSLTVAVPITKRSAPKTKNSSIFQKRLMRFIKTNYDSWGFPSLQRFWSLPFKNSLNPTSPFFPVHLFIIKVTKIVCRFCYFQKRCENNEFQL